MGSFERCMGQHYSEASIFQKKEKERHSVFASPLGMED